MTDRFNQPAQGADNWDEPLNENFADLGIEVTEEVATWGDLPAAGSTSQSTNGQWPVYRVAADDVFVKVTDSAQEIVGGLGSSDHPLPALHTERLNSSIYNAKAYGAVGDGATDDAAAIQAAIDDAQNDGGGVVFIPAGTFGVGSEITLKTDVDLSGAGVGATTIQLLDATDTNVLRVAGNAWKATPTNQKVEALTIDGNKANNSSGIGLFLEESVFYTDFERVHVRSCAEHGLKSVSAHRNTFRSCAFLDNGGSGIFATSAEQEGTGTGVTDNHIELTYCWASDNGTHGFDFNYPVDLAVSRLFASGNGTDGFHIEEAGGFVSSLSGVMTQGNGRNGVRIFGGTRVSLSNVTVNDSAASGVYLENDERTQLSNIRVVTPGSHGIESINSFYLNASTIRGNGFAGDGLHIEEATRPQISGLTTISGTENGIYILDSRTVNLSDVQILDPDRNGILIEETTTTDDINMSNVQIGDPGSSTYPNVSAIEVPDVIVGIKIINFENFDGQTTTRTDYGINYPNAADVLISNTQAKGLTSGLNGDATNVDSETVIQTTL